VIKKRGAVGGTLAHWEQQAKLLISPPVKCGKGGQALQVRILEVRGAEQHWTDFFGQEDLSSDNYENCSTLLRSLAYILPFKHRLAISIISTRNLPPKFIKRL